MTRNAITQLLETQAGDDEFPNETVIRFKYRYPPGSARLPSNVWFTYLAFKINGSWYLTGNQTVGRTWQQLLDFLARGQVKGLRISSTRDWPSASTVLETSERKRLIAERGTHIATLGCCDLDTEKERD